MYKPLIVIRVNKLANGVIGFILRFEVIDAENFFFNSPIEPFYATIAFWLPNIRFCHVKP